MAYFIYLTTKLLVCIFRCPSKLFARNPDIYSSVNDLYLVAVKKIIEKKMLPVAREVSKYYLSMWR